MAKKKPASDSAPSLSFEEALGRLEEIVTNLEQGDLGLEKSLAQYEEGVRLLRTSYEILQRAERRIELLSGVDAQGNPIAEPFDSDDGLSLDEKAQQRGRRRSAHSGTRSSGPSEREDHVDTDNGLF